jgi:hypothetical protein
VLMVNAVCGGLVAGAVWDVVWARIARREALPAAKSPSFTSELTTP